MRYLRILLIACFVTLVARPNAAPGDNLKRWTGAGQDCQSGDSLWSNPANWHDGVPPTSGKIIFSADEVCDPCERCQCVGVDCQPECVYVCDGGPNDGEVCGTFQDCDCCEGGSTLAVYAYSGFPDHYVDSIVIRAGSASDMTLRKVGDRELYVTTGIRLIGSDAHKAVLDSDSGNLRYASIDACGATVIDAQTGVSTIVQDEFRIGCASADTTLTIKGGGHFGFDTEDWDGGVTRVDTYGAAVSTTVLFDNGVFLPGELQIFGGGTPDSMATFQQANSTTSFFPGSLTGLHMRGHSRLHLARPVDFSVVNDIIVDTDGEPTDARIFLLINSRSITASSLTVSAGVDHAATLTIEKGTLNVNGTTTIGAAGATQTATLRILAGAGIPVFGDLILEENGVLEIDGALQINGTLTIDESARIVGTNADIVRNQDTIDIRNRPSRFAPER